MNSSLPPTSYSLQPIPKFIFFGTPQFAVTVLDELKTAGFIPSLIVTAPDKPRGRGLSMTPPSVKLWALQNDVPCLQPIKLNSEFIEKLKAEEFQLFVVAAYGKIIPKNALDLPQYGTLNVHPSLLPKYRGPSPIESAILDGAIETGVSIMLLDEELDHGKIVGNIKFQVTAQMKASELEENLARTGGRLLAETIPKWSAGEIKAEEQKHAEATFTGKITKENGLIDLGDSAEINYKKYKALDVWPGVYFFAKRKNGEHIRVVVKDASLLNGKFFINRVLPEGKKEMDYNDFLRGL